MKIFNTIIFSNIWISLGAVGTTLAFYRFLDEKVNYYYLILVFFATLFAYNFQYISFQNPNKDRQKQTFWIENNLNIIKIITFISLLISIILSVFIFTIQVLSISVPVFLLVVFYKKGSLNKFSLRKIPLAKIVIIAFCWMFSCSIIPGLINNEPFSIKISLLIFLYLIGITLPFDIRDFHFDNQSILTIPHLIGIKSTYILSILILLFLLVINLTNFRLSLFFALSSLIMIPSYKLRSEYYYLFVIDGLLLVFPIFVK